MKPYILSILDAHFLTQADLARILGIDRGHLGKLISGKHTPTLRTIKFIAQGLERVDGQPWRVHGQILRGKL